MKKTGVYLLLLTVSTQAVAASVETEFAAAPSAQATQTTAFPAAVALDLPSALGGAQKRRRGEDAEDAEEGNKSLRRLPQTDFVSQPSQRQQGDRSEHSLDQASFNRVWMSLLSRTQIIIDENIYALFLLSSQNQYLCANDRAQTDFLKPRMRVVHRMQAITDEAAYTLFLTSSQTSLQTTVAKLIS